MSRGVISFVFDDGYAEIMTDALPLLEKYGFKATIAVPVETSKVALTEKTAVAPLAEWKKYCLAHGHELSAHGVNHIPLSTLSDEAIEHELRESKNQTGATTLIYPGGSFNERAKKIAEKYFVAARTTKRGWNTIPPKDVFALNTFNATQKNFSVWKWNIWALKAWLDNSWLIETYHHVNHKDSLHSVKLSVLEAHLKFLRRLPVQFATIAEVVSKNQTS